MLAIKMSASPRAKRARAPMSLAKTSISVISASANKNPNFWWGLRNIRVNGMVLSNHENHSPIGGAADLLNKYALPAVLSRRSSARLRRRRSRTVMASMAARASNPQDVRINHHESANIIWQLISGTDRIIQERAPFKKIKVDKAGAESDIKELMARLDIIGDLLLPIMPETSAKITHLVRNNEMPEAPLFLRK